MLEWTAGICSFYDGVIGLRVDGGALSVLYVQITLTAAMVLLALITCSGSVQE